MNIHRIIFLLSILFCSAANADIEFYKQEIYCLAKNIYFEARGESELGQNAVAHVTINRLFSPRFPNTICDVITQAKRDSNGRAIQNLCQFSWYCDDVSVDIQNKRVYNRIYRIAEYIYINRVLNYNAIEDTTKGSTHFHANYVDPFWANTNSYQRTIQIGLHIFYKPTYE